MFIKVNRKIRSYSLRKKEVFVTDYINSENVVCVGPSYLEEYEGLTRIEFARGPMVDIAYVEESIEDILKMIGAEIKELKDRTHIIEY